MPINVYMTERGKPMKKGDYFDQQAKLPWHRRGRGWWAEIGFANVAGILIGLALVVALLDFFGLNII